MKTLAGGSRACPDPTRGSEAIVPDVPYVVAALLVVVATSVCALLRAPWRRGRNDPLYVSATLVSLAFLCVVPGIYTDFSSLAPLPNWNDLLAKLLLFAGLGIASGQIANVFGEGNASKWLSAPRGQLVLAVVFATEIVLFMASGTTPVGADLHEAFGYSVTARAYFGVAIAYTAYIAILLLPSSFRAAKGPTRVERLVGCVLTFGYGLTVVRAGVGMITLAFDAGYSGGQLLSAVSALAVTAALAIAWCNTRWGGRRALLPELVAKQTG